MICKKCGKELEENSVACPACGYGVKKKKKIYKKWWFWLIVVIVIAIIAANGGGESPDGGENNLSESTAAPQVTYEKVELKDMFTVLEGNAMQAEEKYQGKYVEFSGAISNFDSDGSYISVEAIGADAWDFNSVMCYIKNEEQKAFLLNKSVGDTVNIRGKIKSVGEVLGYSLDIDTVE